MALTLPTERDFKDLDIGQPVGNAHPKREAHGEAEFERARIMQRIGPALHGIKVFGNRVLVAKFTRERVGSGRLLAAAPPPLEDKYQGKIGLVIAKGTIAFQDDDSHQFHGDNVEVGDWVFYAYGDGTDLDLTPPGTAEKVHCKLLKEAEVAGVVPRPDLFW